MKRMANYSAVLASAVLASMAFASDAATSATAGSNSFRRSGTSAATARYDGRVGFARTDTRSGRINLARGVAVGADRNGVTLSVSNAIAPRFGPAVATNFNLGISRDGTVSKSRGTSVSFGPFKRSATAGGSVNTHRRGSGATSFAGGRSDRFGRVHATSHSSQKRGRSSQVLRRATKRALVRTLRH